MKNDLCVSKCPKGEYMFAKYYDGYSKINYTCTKCREKCKECTLYGVCTICKDSDDVLL